MQSTTIGLLLDATLKGTVLLMAATGLVMVLRRGSAASRHLIWQFALLGVLCLPLIKSVSPYRLAVLPQLRSPVVATETVAPDVNGGQEVRKAGGQEVRRSGGQESSSTARTSIAPTMLRWTGIIWLAITAALMLRMLLGFILVRWFALRAYPLYEEGWGELNAELCGLMGIKGTVQLFASPHIATPMTWGIFHPVVMMPSAAEDWTMERRRVVLLHELAHVRRRDSLMHMFAHFACAVYWFHPLVWKAAARMRAEAERACDDLVLRAGTKASVYADHLLELIRTIGGMRTPALALPMAQRSTFEGRLLAILEPHLDRTAPRPVSVAGMLMVSALILFPLAGLTTANAVKPAVKKDISISDKASSEKLFGDVLPEIKNANALATATATSTEFQQQVQQASVVQSTSNAIRALIVALGDEDAEVRLSSAQALGQMEDSSAVAALMNALRSDNDARVRKAAAWALGQIESAQAVPALVHAMQSDSDREVRETAVWALGQIEDDAAVPGLVQVLKSGDVEMRKQAAWALGQIENASAVPGLIGALKDENADVRSQAVWALGEIESESAVNALMGILNDPDADTRKQVAWALGQIESADAVPGLSNALRTDKDAEVRQQSAWALGQIEDRAAVPALGAALKDANTEVRKQAAWALGQIEDASAGPFLRAAVKDSDPEVRREVLQALINIGDELGYDQLAEMLKDPDPEVRRAAAQAMGGGHSNPNPQPRPQPRPRPRPIH